MTLYRVAATAALTLTHTWLDDETPVDPTGTIAVTVIDAVGTQIDSATATAGPAGSGTATYRLAGQPDPTLLTVTWTATIAGATVVEHDIVEVCGGHFFTLAEGRASDESLSDTARYTTEQLRGARLEVERECERITDRAWVARYARVVVDGVGTDELQLIHPEDDRSVNAVRAIRSVLVAARPGATPVALTNTQLAALTVDELGVVRRTDDIWPDGRALVTVEYVYGEDYPPPDLVRGCLIRLRSRLNLHRSQVPDRAESFTATSGGTYRLSLPAKYRTGVPEVDAVYARYSQRGDQNPATAGAAGTTTSGGPTPVSRTFSYDPQWGSLFHGGRR